MKDNQQYHETGSIEIHALARATLNSPPFRTGLGSSRKPVGPLLGLCKEHSPSQIPGDRNCEGD